MDTTIIRYPEVSLTMVSPVDREECIVEAEAHGRLLFVLGDEERTEYLVEFAHEEYHPFAIPFEDLVRILGEAKQLLRRA